MQIRTVKSGTNVFDWVVPDEWSIKNAYFEDEEGKSWLPSTINLPKQGMVFANGSKPENWKWAAVKATEVKEEEKERYPIPNKEGEYYEHRMDMTTMKMFDERDFLEALDYIGLFEKDMY